MPLFQMVKYRDFACRRKKTPDKQPPQTFSPPSHLQNNNKTPEHPSIFGFYFAFIIQRRDLPNDYRLENTSENSRVTLRQRSGQHLSSVWKTADSCEGSSPRPPFIFRSFKNKPLQKEITNPTSVTLGRVPSPFPLATSTKG